MTGRHVEIDKGIWAQDRVLESLACCRETIWLRLMGDLGLYSAGSGAGVCDPLQSEGSGAAFNDANSEQAAFKNCDCNSPLKKLN